MSVDSRLLEQNKAVTRQFMEQFKNKHDFAVIDQLFSPAATILLPADGLPEGPAGQKAMGDVVFAAFPDVHVTLDYAIAEGDRVAERHTARATHRGVFLGIPATGKAVSWTENHFYRLEDSRIVELCAEWSLQRLMEQLGAAGARA